jgi:ribosomal protein S21
MRRVCEKEKPLREARKHLKFAEPSIRRSI